jgi:hypothetical protein
MSRPSLETSSTDRLFRLHFAVAEPSAVAVALLGVMADKAQLIKGGDVVASFRSRPADTWAQSDTKELVVDMDTVVGSDSGVRVMAFGRELPTTNSVGTARDSHIQSVQAVSVGQGGCRQNGSTGGGGVAEGSGGCLFVVVGAAVTVMVLIGLSVDIVLPTLMPTLMRAAKRRVWRARCMVFF